MRDWFRLEFPSPAWPGGVLEVELVADARIRVDEVEWRIAGAVSNSLGASRRIAADKGRITIARTLEREGRETLRIPVPTGRPPTLSIDGAATRWQIGLAIDTEHDRVEMVHDVELTPAPADVDAADLTDPDEVSVLMRKRRRVQTWPTGKGFVVIVLLSMAIGIPIGFGVFDDDETQQYAALGLAFAVMVALLIGNFVLYGRRDSFPFSADRVTARRGQRVNVQMATPPVAELSVSVATRVWEYKRTGQSSGPEVVRWILGPVATIGPSSLGASVEVPADVFPTLQTESIKVDHWIRVQPSSSVGSDQRFQRDRSDRPIFVVA